MEGYEEIANMTDGEELAGEECEESSPQIEDDAAVENPPQVEVKEEKRKTNAGLFGAAKMNANERRVAAYLDKNASEPLRVKIAEAVAQGFGISKCFKYITECARKKAVSGCAMIEDETVFGWAVHYYEDEWMAERDKKEEAGLSETARVAKMTPEEREKYLKEKEEKEREAKEKEDALKAEREEREKERQLHEKMLKEWYETVYSSFKRGDAVLDNPEWTDEQRKIFRDAKRKARADLAEERKVAKERAEGMQMTLF